VTVSHDRHFVSNIANKIWYIEDHELKEYPGTYDEYEFWKENIRKEALLGKQSPQPPKQVQVKAPVAPAAPKTNNEPLRRQLAELETTIAKLEKDKDQIEVELSDPSVYAHADKLLNHTKLFEKVSAELTNKQKQWEELYLSLEGGK
ncbi:MAG: ABC transporter ATP-binding protein, partial [Cytophagales bacterium]|nr:ABC transporter ATP-binding protein [Cytophagales bacterium]